MDPKDIMSILATEEDMLKPIRTRGPKHCPGCGGALSVLADGPTFFTLRCSGCGFEMDPETGLVRNTGRPETTVEPDAHLIQPAVGSGDRS
jgi:hypothetical protein